MGLHIHGRDYGVSIDQIEHEVLIDAPQERVWAVLTEAEHVAGWFGDRAEVDLRPGGAMLFGWTQYDSHYAARIERVEPPGFFSYRWAREPGGEVAAGISTLVEFTLTPAAAGQTVLRVVESGFASLTGGDEERATAVKENTEGWQSELGELKEYAERIAA
jgi:uncharacterized protein YndB with AHSA1/START domain